MSRLSRLLLLFVLLVFALACNFITRPIEDVQNLAGTAESIASEFPLETLQAIPSVVSVETLEALPSAIPNIEEFNYFDPQGTPLSEWKEVPIMPEATAGQEFNNGGTYSFKVNADVQAVQDYYNSELEKRGWSSTFNLPADESGAVMVFSKESSLLTVTITSLDGEVVVVLALA